MPREPYLERIESVVPLAGKAVLDIGCGDGVRSKDLARLAELVVAVDPDVRAIRRAQRSQRRRNLQYRRAAASHLPFPNESFDVVVFTMSFHHVATKDMARALREAIRVTRRRGYLVAYEPDWAGSLYDAEQRFDFGDGDNRATKAYAYHVLLTEPKLEEIGEFIDGATFTYRSLADFVRRERPRRGTANERRSFLERHRFRLDADQRVNVFRRR